MCVVEWVGWVIGVYEYEWLVCVHCRVVGVWVGVAHDSMKISFNSPF